jgi:hypothetical protein
LGRLWRIFRNFRLDMKDVSMRDSKKEHFIGRGQNSLIGTEVA